jgi:hypothetical protein
MSSKYSKTHIQHVAGGDSSGPREGVPVPCQNREFNRIYQGASGCLSVHDMILTICECSCEKSVRYQLKLRRFARRKSERGGCPRKCQSTCGRRSLMTLQLLIIFKKASVKSLLFERCSHFPLVLSLATCQTPNVTPHRITGNRVIFWLCGCRNFCSKL